MTVHRFYSPKLVLRIVARRRFVKSQACWLTVFLFLAVFLGSGLAAVMVAYLSVVLVRAARACEADMERAVLICITREHLARTAGEVALWRKAAGLA